ncbi:MAG: nucleotide exchange factor GrpE [Nanoarchaeota archaeon]|nr:nucleotide exchange factor GrpE [Nanoarchaeota archaeon]
MKKANKQDSRVEELTNDVKRIQADFINFKNRVEKEKENYARYKLENFVLKLLEVIDNFELSLKNNKDKGVEMVYKQFLDILEKEGIKKITENEEFDANLHEAVEKVVGEENKVIEIIKDGYMFNENVLRPTIVKVGGGK